MNNIPLEKVPSIDYSNGGTVSLPASWITAINALIAASGGVSGLTAGRLPYAASATSLADSANATLDANGSLLARFITIKSSASGLNPIWDLMDSTGAVKWEGLIGASNQFIIQDFVNNKNVISLTPGSTPTITLLGNLNFNSDNAYDIGASGANRPKNVYIAGTVTIGSGVLASGNVQAGATSYIYWVGRGLMASPADGIITLSNQGGTDFSRLQFGGTTSSFPAIKRNGTGLDIRLADDSAMAALRVDNITATSNGSAAIPSIAVTGAGDVGFYYVSGTYNVLLGTVSGGTAGAGFRGSSQGGGIGFGDGYPLYWTINGNPSAAAQSGMIQGGVGIIFITDSTLAGATGNLRALTIGAASDGSLTTPAIGFRSTYNYGLYRTNTVTNGISVSIAGSDSLIQFNTGGFNISSTGVLGFTTTADPSNTKDANFSRISAGVIGLGTGAAASIAGTLQLAKIITGSGSAAGSITLTSTSVSGVYCNVNTSSQVANDIGYNLSFVGAITGELLPAYWQGAPSLGFPFRMTNSDNTNSTAHCYHRITVGGGSGGDAFTRFEVSGVTDWSIGVDNSDSDSLKIGPNADPSTGSALLTISTAGLFTFTEGGIIAAGTTTGLKLLNNTAQKLGFWNATPVVQQVLATGGGATVDNVITLLQTLGLCKQS